VALSRIVCEINDNFGRKSQIFSSSVSNAAEEVFLEFCNGVGAQDTTVMLLPGGGKKFDDMFIRLDTISQCDGQTDRQTDRQTNGQTMVKQYRALLGMPCMLMRVKKSA